MWYSVKDCPLKTTLFMNSHISVVEYDHRRKSLRYTAFYPLVTAYLQHTFLLLPLCSPALPFIGWPHTNGCVTHGGPGRMLLREMLWQLEQRALQVQEEEFQYCISRGILGYRHPPAYPSLLALIPASEHRQLERLCGRIPPSHTAIVLSR